jgi:putative membrane protein
LAANQTPLRIALGGWLTPALIGAAQMVVVLAVVGLAVDITPVNWLGTLGFLLLTSATFIAIVHMLNALLGAPGQFLGLVLMVVQLVTAGGTFPWQTIPEPLHPLHHVLPMSYAVDGLRQLMYGGLSGRVVSDVVVLAAFLVGALLLTSYGARRQRVWKPKRVRPEIAL